MEVMNRLSWGRRIKSQILFVIVIMIALAQSWGNESFGKTRYFELIPDLPIMEGMQPIPEESAVFDKAQGRIVIQIAKSDSLSKEQIKEFYKQTLPALGWKYQRNSVYLREGEALEIEIFFENQKNKVKFFLRPAHAR